MGKSQSLLVNIDLTNSGSAGCFFDQNEKTFVQILVPDVEPRNITLELRHSADPYIIASLISGGDFRFGYSAVFDIVDLRLITLDFPVLLWNCHECVWYLHLDSLLCSYPCDGTQRNQSIAKKCSTANASDEINETCHSRP